MTSAQLKQEAVWWGAKAIGTVYGGYDYLAAFFARQAAHNANLYLEHLRIARAPLEQVLANKVAQSRRQAATLRCSCRGKLVVKKRAGVVVAVECRVCGRALDIPPAAMPMTNEVAPITAEQWEAIDAAHTAGAPVVFDEVGTVTPEMWDTLIAQVKANAE